MASVIRGSGTSSLGGDLDIEGVLTYEDVASVDSVGIITARSGIDVGTGTSISSPSSNVLTLGTNNEERLLITSGGDMGLGTASPRSITNFGSFAINGTAGAFTDYFLNGTRTGTTAVDSNGFTSEAVGSSTPFRVITNGTEKLRIDSDGKLILSMTQRTTSHLAQGDGAMLIEQSYGGNLTALTIRNKDTDAAAATSIGFSLNRTGGDYDFVSGQIKSEKEQSWTLTDSTIDSAMVFSTTEDNTLTERLRISSGGFITQKFTSNNSTTAEGLFINNLNNGTGNNASLILSNDSGERKKAAIALIDTGNYGAGDLVFAVDGADSGELHLTNDEKLRITSGGAVLGPEKYNGSYTASSNLDITGFGYGNYLVNVRSNGTYHWNGVLLVTMFDTADFGVATLVSGNYSTTHTANMVNLSTGNGTLRLVFNRDFGNISVRVLQIG